jgi:hypothetical protein
MMLDVVGHRADLYRELSRNDYKTLVDCDTLGTLSDSVKFVLLRSVIPQRVTDQLYQALSGLPFQPAANSRRVAVRSRVGGELHFGWVNRQAEGVHQFKPTLDYPLVVAYWLAPLLNAFSNLMKLHLPAQWEAQQHAAAMNGHMTLGSEWQQPDKLAFLRSHLLHDQPVCRPLLPIFSTLTLNQDLICRLHRDGQNHAGLSCMTAVGKWKGDEFCMPRYGVAFAMQPGDVLMADTRNEPHGNINHFGGSRISVVAYLQPLK